MEDPTKMSCTKESTWFKFISHFSLLTYFVILSTTGVLSQNKGLGGTWQMRLDVDNYFSIRNAWSSEGKSVSVVVYDTNENKQYALSLITTSDEWNHFNFPEDFIALSDQSKDSLLAPQWLTFEIRVKRNVEQRKAFYYDPSPNALLQLEYYPFKEKLDTTIVWGKLIDAYRWEDKKGENVVVRSELSIRSAFSDTTSYSKYLYLYHFKKENENLQLVRKFTDVYSGCNDVPNASFSLPSIELTDIDRDTVGEISVIYDLYCDGSDTTNYNSKLLLTTEGKKFMLDATVDPCAESTSRITAVISSSSFQFYPYLLRYMQDKLGVYHQP